MQFTEAYDMQRDKGVGGGGGGRETDKQETGGKIVTWREDRVKRFQPFYVCTSFHVKYWGFADLFLPKGASAALHV